MRHPWLRQKAAGLQLLSIHSSGTIAGIFYNTTILDSIDINLYYFEVPYMASYKQLAGSRTIHNSPKVSKPAQHCPMQYDLTLCFTRIPKPMVPVLCSSQPNPCLLDLAGLPQGQSGSAGQGQQGRVASVPLKETDGMGDPGRTCHCQQLLTHALHRHRDRLYFAASARADGTPFNWKAGQSPGLLQVATSSLPRS